MRQKRRSEARGSRYPPWQEFGLYGDIAGGARIRLTKPKATYRLHHPISISLFYDSPARTSAGYFGTNPPSKYLGTDHVCSRIQTDRCLTSQETPGSTSSVHRELFWVNAAGIDMDY